MNRYKRKFKETVINLKKMLKDIGNLEVIPNETQKFLYREVDSFRSIGFQEVVGYIDRQIIISMEGFWGPDNKFYILSYGIGNISDELKIQYPRLQMQWKD